VLAHVGAILSAAAARDVKELLRKILIRSSFAIPEDAVEHQPGLSSVSRRGGLSSVERET
jgi:hypothetical protein